MIRITWISSANDNANEDHLCQSTEHPSHRLVVQPLRTVDDNDIHAHSLPQVLYCLCLPCACWALGAAPTSEVEGCSECHVAAR